MSFYNNVNVLLYKLTTGGLCLLERAKVFTIPPLLVQTVSLRDEGLPPPSVARHAYKLKRMVTYELATRAQYEEALRHYQVAVKEMRSPDRYDASQA